MNKVFLCLSAIVISVQLKDKTHAAVTGSLELQADGSIDFNVQKVLVDDETNESVNLGEPQKIVIDEEGTKKLSEVLTDVLDAAFNHPKNAKAIASVANQAAATENVITTDKVNADVAALQSDAVVDAHGILDAEAQNAGDTKEDSGS